MLTLMAAAVGAALSAVVARSARRADVAARLNVLRTRGRRQTMPALPPWLRSWLTSALRDADVHVPPEDASVLWLATAGALGLVASSVAFTAGVIVLLGALAGGPLLLWSARRRAQRRFVAALPAVLEQLAAQLRGGGTIAEGVAVLAARESVIGRDFRDIERRTRLGMPLADSLTSWSEARPHAFVQATAGALAIASSTGGRAADALDGLSQSLRDQLEVAAEARALSTQARLSALVVACAPVGFVVIGTVLDPGSSRILLGTGYGRICLVVGLALEALGVAWMRRLVVFGV